MSVDAPGCERWKIAAVVRFVAKRARQIEELGETNDSHLQMSRRLYVSRQKSVVIARVIVSCFQTSAHSRKKIEQHGTLARRTLHLLHVALTHIVNPLAYLLVREPFVAQSFRNNL